MKKTTLIFSFLLVFTLFFTINTYAAEYEIPSLPTINATNYHYVIYNNYADTTDINGLKLHVFIPDIQDDDFTISCYRAVSGYNNFTVSSNESYQHHMYYYENGDWKYHKTSTVSKESNYYSSTVNILLVHYSTFDIFEADKNTLFFQKTPMPLITVPTLEETLAEEIPATANKIIQAMTTILLCGVGCLALLIGLPVLARVFGKFHVK